MRILSKAKRLNSSGSGQKGRWGLMEVGSQFEGYVNTLQTGEAPSAQITGGGSFSPGSNLQQGSF